MREKKLVPGKRIKQLYRNMKWAYPGKSLREFAEELASSQTAWKEDKEAAKAWLEGK